MAKAQVGSVFPIEGGKRYKATLTLKDEFGLPFRKHFTGKDPKALRQKMRQYKADHEAGRPVEGMKVEAMCLAAIEACEKRGCAPKTTQGYRQFLKNHIGPTIGAMQVHELKAAHVERMLEAMEGKGIGSQTQALCRNFVRMAINRVAMKNGLVSVNAAALADTPKIKHASRRSLKPADLERILAAEDRPLYRALWLFLASTGLRPGEALGLLWQDLKRQPDGWWLTLRESKTEIGTLPVPVPSSLIAELEALPKRGLYVFSTANGTPLEYHNVRREWLAALKKADVPFTNLYQLRKLFGTLKARRVSDSVLKRLMRHTDVRTTKQYYVSAIEEDLRAAVED